MQYNKGSDSNPIWVTLEVVNGSLFVKDDQGVILWATQGNPSTYLNPQPFTSLEEAYDWFLTHPFSDRIE